MTRLALKKLENFGENSIDGKVNLRVLGAVILLK